MHRAVQSLLARQTTRRLGLRGLQMCVFVCVYIFLQPPGTLSNPLLLRGGGVGAAWGKSCCCARAELLWRWRWRGRGVGRGHGIAAARGRTRVQGSACAHRRRPALCGAARAAGWKCGVESTWCTHCTGVSLRGLVHYSAYCGQRADNACARVFCQQSSIDIKILSAAVSPVKGRASTACCRAL